MPLIDIRDVSRAYGSIQALSRVTLRLEPGTIGLVGNNGAGKSTLLKILLGLLRPDSGSGTILDCDILTSSRDLRGRVGYMPEAAAIVPVLKGVEFVSLAGDLYGMPHREARRRAHEVLNYVGLGELRYRRLEEYSTGNLQRLKLAAALVHDPQLLLLDEPTNGLDPQGRIAMLRTLEDLIAETGKSVIICTHLLGDVERLCDQVVVLHRGTILQSGPMASLRATLAGRYRLSWRGDAGNFLPRLRALGAVVAQGESADEALVEVAADFHTLQFFQTAREAEVVITGIKPLEENLEQLFFRVTDAAHAPAAPQPAAAGEVAHGH